MKMQNRFIFISSISTLALLLDFSISKSQVIDSKKDKIQTESINITGVIIDSLAKKAISYYKFEVYNNLKKDRIDTFTTDRAGRFSFFLQKTRPSLVIKPFELFQAKGIVVNLPDSLINSGLAFDVGELAFNLEGLALNEILIKGKRSNNPLARTYIVKKLSTAESPIFSSYIKTLPGISIQNNEIFVDGRKKPRFYINGIEASIEIVKNLPLEVISKIEVISSPPLSKRVGINESIINIITKRDSGLLLGGLVNAGKGLILNTNTEAINLYSSTKNSFLNLSLSSYSNNYSAKSNAAWTNNEVAIFTETSDSKYELRPLFGSLNFKYSFSDKLTINTLLSYNYQNLNYLGNWFLIQPNFASNAEITNTIYKKTDNNYVSNTELSYKSNEKSAYYLGFMVSGLKYDNNILNSSPPPIGSETDTRSISKSLAVQLRNELTLSKLTIEEGLIFNKLNSSTNFAQSILNSNNQMGASKYDIGVLSAFLNVTIPIKKSVIVIGSRLDYNDYNLGSSLLEDKLKAYIFTPSATYMLPTDKNGTFILSYQRDINLPGISNINTAIISIKPNSFNTGSEGLQPEIINNFDLYNIKDFSNKNLIIDVFYNKTRKLIDYTRFNYISANNSLIRQYANLGDLHKFGGNISFTTPILKKITLNSNLRFEHYFYNFDGKINSLIESYRFKGNLIQFSTDLSYAISSTLSTNINCNYQNVNYYPFLAEYQTSPDISFELNKSILKQKINLSLAWSSVLNWGNTTNSTYLAYAIYGKTFETLRTQNLIFSVSYNFGKKTVSDNTSPKSIETRKLKSSKSI